MVDIFSNDLLSRVLISIVILAITYGIDFAFGRIVLRAVGGKSRHSAYEIGRIGSIVIWIGGILSVLPILGASDVVVAVVILLVGAFLIIVTKDFASNWFSGQMIRTIAPFRVGDWIKTPGGQYGRVTRIEGLFTILVTHQNETIVIPNAKLTSDLIVDRTTSGSLKVPIDLQVSPQVEFGELTLGVARIAKELSPYLSDAGPKKAEPEIYVLSRSPDYVKVRVLIKIDNVAKEEEVASEFRKRFSLLGFEAREVSESESQTNEDLSGKRSIER